MQPISPDAKCYDGATLFFYWATAILVVTQWLGAQIIDWFPKGPLRVDARSVHITFGLLLAALLVARIGWRLTGGRRLPLADRRTLNIVAKATHWGLYTLLAAMVMAGMAVVWTQADSLFNLFSVPAYDPGNPDLGDQVKDIHGTIGWLILALSGLHASAALVHRYIWHDGVLARMLPRR